MRLKGLRLENFRGFENATVSLDRPLTVFLGINGSGKSSVLDAIGMVLADTSLPAAARLAPSVEDIRQGLPRLKIQLHRSDVAMAPEPTLSLTQDGARTSHDSIALFGMNSARPVLVYYDSSRSVPLRPQTHDAASGRPTAQAVATHLVNALPAALSGFRDLFRWFKDREDVENEQKVTRADLNYRDPLLSAVRRAVESMLDGFHDLRVQRDPLHLTVRKGDTTLFIDQLSDGERTTLVMAADLARRLSLAYSDHADPLQGEGVVLIDEIELHLHPSWQRRILRDLRRTFPNVQFIVTTHSPLVISEVDNDAVVGIRDFQFVHPVGPTEGQEVSAILRDIMGTPGRPERFRTQIAAIERLIDDEDLAQAAIELEKLARVLTESDRDVVGLRTAIHFLQDSNAVDP